MNRHVKKDVKDETSQRYLVPIAVKLPLQPIAEVKEESENVESSGSEVEQVMTVRKIEELQQQYALTEINPSKNKSANQL